MNKTPFALAALITLSACARTEPVSDDALDDVDLAELPAIADDVTGADQDASALLPDAMSWRIDGDSAFYGDGPAEPVLEMACADSGGSLSLTRYGVAGSGSAGTVSIVGNGASATVPVVAAQAGTAGQFNWTADQIEGAIADSIREAFLTDSPVNINATGTEALILTATPELRDLLERCVGEGGEADNEPAGATPADATAPDSE